MVKKLRSQHQKRSADKPPDSRLENNSILESLKKIITSITGTTENNTSDREQSDSSENKTKPISYKVKDNEQYLKKIFVNCSDLVVREIKIASNQDYGAMFVYLAGMVKQDLLEEAIVKKLVSQPADTTHLPNIKDYVQYLLGIRPEDIYEKMDEALNAILESKVVIFVNGVNAALTIDFKSPPSRSVNTPETETSLRGPREAFIESKQTNISLIRKRIKNINLKVEPFQIGRQTKTDVNVCYIKGIANDKIVNEVRERLNKIDIDGVLANTYIEEYIEDSPFFIFPTIFRTERPDIVVGKLLEGYIAIITDGTPIALVVPYLFVDSLKATDDYYLKYISGTLTRWIRSIAFFLTLTLPGFYVALLTFHQELIPYDLVTTLIKSRAGVPLPVMWECISMLFAYAILKEAGIRMPRVVGPAISIVGALVLGQAAVEAGLVSTLTVVVVALSAIAALTTPTPEMNIYLMPPRFILLFLGGTLGMLGLIGGIMILFVNMISARSFGVPYMAPLAPLMKNELSDVVVRGPFWSMLKRSKLITRNQSTRKKPR
ncbi:MAG: GerA spore germination protein [Firmicutes bacterium]|nr:GerA spore germination protein [Bacillota bacterium]